MSERMFELILAIKRQCQRSEEQIQEELGLSQAQFNALIVLENGREISGCEFAERMALSASRGSRVLDKLVTDGHVQAVPGSKDRRAIVISLTPQGRQVKQRVIDRMEACERRICDGLDEESIGQIKHALKSLAAVL